MNSEEPVNSEIDKTAEDEKKSNNLEEEQECSQAVVESKNGDDIDNDMDKTEVENKYKAGEEPEQKDDSSASAEDDKKSETGKESSEVNKTCNEKASESIDNGNIENVVSTTDQIVENKEAVAVQDSEQNKEGTASTEEEEKSKYFKEGQARSEASENIHDAENVIETAEPKVKDNCEDVQESEKKEDSQDQDTLKSSQETVINDSQQENSGAGPLYFKEDFFSADSAGSATEGNSESEDNTMGPCISKSKKKSHSKDEFSDEDEQGLPKEDSKKTDNGKESWNKKARKDSNEWTREEEQQEKKSKEDDKKWKLRRKHSERDTGNYRDGYPGKVDDPRKKKNLKFYTGKIPCEPDGDFIDNIHKEWWGDYNLLERHHGYIQWIFPIREDGMNWQAQPLQKHEAEAIKADPVAHARVLMSYRMMLDFYGMRLVNVGTGELKRTTDYEDRYENLNWSGHNYLRITRILKSLGEFGYEHLKKGFVQFVLKEALVKKALPRTFTSCRDYWIGTIKNEKDRDDLYQYIEDNID